VLDVGDRLYDPSCKIRVRTQWTGFVIVLTGVAVTLAPPEC